MTTQPAAATTATTDSRQHPSWQRHSFRAMNTDVHAWLYSTRPRGFARRTEEAFRYFEQLLSRFRPTSELSRLNDHDGGVYEAGPDLVAAIEAALWAAQQTDGLFDPTILDDLERAGYDRTFAAVANRAPLGSGVVARPDVGSTHPAPTDRDGRLDYRAVRVDAFSRLIARPRGLRLDLGGMGKGWTVDRLADELGAADRWTSHFLINAGGDIYAYGGPHDSRGWRVELTHPVRPELSFATVRVNHHAVATSTIARRRWMKDGAIRHHLIDPRTGRPAETDAVSVSVIGERVFTAEVYAKVALIQGVDEGIAFLELLPNVEGAIVGADERVSLTSGMGRYLDRIDPAGYRPHGA